jgi:two-component system NtrC family sensor kinase
LSPQRDPPQPAARPLRRRLGFRLAAGLALGAGAILATAMVLNLRLQRQHLTRLVEGQAAELVEAVRGSTRQAMLENNAAALDTLIDTLVAQQGIDRIRAFDKQGASRSRASPPRSGAWSTATPSSASPATPPASRSPTSISPAHAHLLLAAGEGRVGLIARIHNEPSCSTAACHAHPPEQEVLGVLDVQLPLAASTEPGGIQRQLLAGWRRPRSPSWRSPGC